MGNKIFPIAKGLSAPVAFIEQISAKHRQTMGSAFTNAPTTQKLKILTNIVTGSTTGINFFKDEFQAPQTLNPSGVLNKWTQNGAIMLVYSVLGKNVNKVAGQTLLPATAKVGAIGKQFIIGGGVGGFFDDPEDRPQSTSQKGTARFSPQPQLQIARLSGYSGSDSTESGL